MNLLFVCVSTFHMVDDDNLEAQTIVGTAYNMPSVLLTDIYVDQYVAIKQKMWIVIERVQTRNGKYISQNSHNHYSAYQLMSGSA